MNPGLLKSKKAESGVERWRFRSGYSPSRPFHMTFGHASGAEWLTRHRECTVVNLVSCSNGSGLFGSVSVSRSMVRSSGSALRLLGSILTEI